MAIYDIRLWWSERKKEKSNLPKIRVFSIKNSSSYLLLIPLTVYVIDRTMHTDLHMHTAVEETINRTTQFLTP